MQLDLALAQAREGMSRALEHAEADVPAWGDLALQWLRKYAETHAQFPGWFVTEESSRDPNFPAPKNSRAWGAIWKQAQRLGIIEATNRTMPHPRRHGCPAVVWRSLVLLEPR